MKLLLATVAAGVAALALATSAKANFIAVYTSNSANVYNYTLRFTQDQASETLKSGDTVTLYDLSVPANITSVVAPAGFTVTQQLTGITPAALVGAAGLPDSGTLQNITFTYTGADKTSAADFTGAVVTMTSAYSQLAVGKESGSTEINFNLNNDSTVHQDTSIRAVLLPGLTTSTPEPASLAVMGLGAAAVLVRRRKA